MILNLQDTNLTEVESADAPKIEKKTEESADDDKNDEVKTNEKSDEKKVNAKDEDQKPEIKTEEKSESDAEKSTESKSNESSSEENEQKKSDEVEQNETTEKPDEKPSTDNESSNKHDVYTGEVHDPNVKPEERHNYRPINIMFRRKCQNPKIRIQFDRTVIFKNQTFYLNVDGKNVRLVASPPTLETYDDIKTLLQIVNDISLSSCCVESVTQIS